MNKFKFGDLVSRRDGGLGVVIWSGSNRAIITWQDDHGNPIEHYAGGSLDGITLATPPPNTVPVRIAVAVDEHGDWDAQGCINKPAETLADWVRENVGGVCRVSFITAHVPLPEQPAEVEGKVE
jgi:hypothetical protein